LESLGMEMVGMGILWPFGIYNGHYGHLVHFTCMAIWRPAEKNRRFFQHASSSTKISMTTARKFESRRFGSCTDTRVRSLSALRGET
jgi:hypothetical protein